MAKVSLNALTSHLRGRVGDLVFKRYGDRLVVTRVPQFKKKRTLSKGEQSRQKKFAAANRYALGVLNDPKRRAAYAALAKKSGRSIQLAAISDFLTVPVIHGVEARRFHGNAGDEILIDTDNGLKVSELQVAIRGERGKIVEEGMAESVRGVWTYAAKLPYPPDSRLTLDVIARDRAGHTVRYREPMVVK